MKQYTLKNPDVFKPKKVEPDFQDVLQPNLKGSVVEFYDRAIEDIMYKARNGELLCCRCGKPATSGSVISKVVEEDWKTSLQFRIVCNECEVQDATD